MNKLSKKDQTKKHEFKLSTSQKLLMFLAIILLSFWSLQIVIILLIGLLPSITVMLTDSKNTHKLIIVGFFNLAGMFICVANIYNQFITNHAINIMDNVFNIIIMLGSAALGMILYFELPNVFVMISRSSASRRLRNIDSKLEKISAEWGSEVYDHSSKKL